MEVKELISDWNTPREQFEYTICHDIEIVLLEGSNNLSDLRHVCVVHYITRWRNIEENSVIVEDVIVDLNCAILLLVLEVICLIKVNIRHGSDQIPVSHDIELNVLKSVNIAIQLILYPYFHLLKCLILCLQYTFSLEV